MYYKIKRFREDEKFSIQRIADHFGVNFRTVKKYLSTADEEFEKFLIRLAYRCSVMDTYKNEERI